MTRLSRLISAVSMVLALSAGPVLAAGGGSNNDPLPAKKVDTNYTLAQQKIDDGQYAAAIELLEKVVAKDQKNADALNLLGYSNRQLGNNDVALGHYEAALELNPRHRGANEYMGELYLTLGEIEKAEERLDVLDGACFFGCKEYSMLKEAIADYRAKIGS